MLTLHETSRRYLCRLVFVLVCAAPTLLLLAAVWWARGAALQKSLEQQISQATGWAITTKHVTWPKPRVIIVRGFLACDNESGSPILAAKSLEIERQSDQIIVRAEQPILKPGKANTVGESVTHLLSRQLLGCDRIVIEPCELKLELGQEVKRLTEFTVTLQNNPQDSVAVFGCRLTADPDAKPARLRILRDRRASPAETEFKMRTGETPIACDLLQAMCPLLLHLGDRATFCGEVSLRQSAIGLKGKLSGDVADIEMQSAVDAFFSEPASGLATLHLDVAQLDEGRLVSAKGSLHAGPGSLGGAFVESFARNMSCPLAKAEVLVRNIRFGNLAFNFDVDAHRSLTLRGECPRDAILVDDHGQAVVFSPASGVPVWSLARLMAPADAASGPLSKQSSDLLAWLPLPDVRMEAFSGRQSQAAKRSEPQSSLRR